MIVFLAGAHGVGKTYLASRVAAKVSLQHVTASQLIREERGRQTWTVDRLVAEVDENQMALINAVERCYMAGDSLLLDGHFVLRGKDGQLVRVDASVFARLHINATVLLEAQPEIVARRLASRAPIESDIDSIRALAAAERDHAIHVCGSLKIPMMALTTPTEEDFAGVLEEFLTR